MNKGVKYKLWLAGILLLLANAIFAQGGNVLDNLYVKENTSARPARVHLNDEFKYPYYVIDDINRRVLLRNEGATGLDFNHYLKNAQDPFGDSMTDKQKEFIARIAYYREYYLMSPFKCTGCVFFNPSFHGIDYIMQNLQRLPEAFRFYATPMGDTVIGGSYTMKMKLNKPLADFMEPFYFAQTAVTNAEYREFVNYVRDSLIHLKLYDAGDVSQGIVLDGMSDLYPPVINWNAKINYDSPAVQEALSDLYKPENERFYRRKEIDTRKLMYFYYLRKGPDTTTSVVINVYPDTLAWINCFPYDFLEPMTNMYFWHPVFDNYPVVGITKKQAEAFLHWKTDKEQKRLNKLGKGEWVVTYELPTEYEWEMAETAGNENDKSNVYPDYVSAMSDYSYVTDLLLKADSDSNRTIIHSDTREMITSDKGGKVAANNAYDWWNHSLLPTLTGIQNLSYTMHMRWTDENKNEKGTPISKGYINYQLLMADFLKNAEPIRKNAILAINYDCNGISFMGGNVSEWLKETYTGNYKAVYNYRHKLLSAIGGKEIELLLATEDFYNSMNDTDWVVSGDYASLVRGGNWFDDRFSGKAGRNTDGMNAKTFVNTSFAYPTLGFRYVVKVHRKDEKQIIDKMKKNIAAIK